MESTISISTSGGPVLEHNAWLAKSWNSVGTSLWLFSF